MTDYNGYRVTLKLGSRSLFPSSPGCLFTLSVKFSLFCQFTPPLRLNTSASNQKTATRPT